MNRSILLKPASSLCNLHCSYCFYLDEVENRSFRKARVMDEETMQAIITKSIEESDGISFAFQGGEPTIAGTSYFERFFSYVDKVNTSHKPISYALQTNGYNLDPALIPLLKKYKVLVGISLDGPRQIHNYHRTLSTGEETFQKVRDTVRCLQAEGIEVNLLSVVTDQTALNAEKVITFFLKQGQTYLQFIPCLSPFAQGEANNPFLHTENYLLFLETAWKYWYANCLTDHPISIRLFDNWLMCSLGTPPEACGAQGICSIQYVIEFDGSVYPCDFYCLDTFLLGNINQNSLEEIDHKRESIGFIPSSLTSNLECENCPYLRYCGGGCKRYRKDDGKFAYCDVYKTFLTRHLKELQHVASLLTTRQSQ